jgi:hypothetical protein
MCGQHDEHGHDHHHHDHHRHQPSDWAETAHVHGGMPLLDIGGDIGAMVVTVDDRLGGTEVFAHRAGEPAHTAIHTAAWARHLGDEHVTAAVFCELSAGDWMLVDPTDGDPVPVTITGGEVATIDLTPARTTTN